MKKKVFIWDGENEKALAKGARNTRDGERPRTSSTAQMRERKEKDIIRMNSGEGPHPQEKNGMAPRKEGEGRNAPGLVKGGAKA